MDEVSFRTRALASALTICALALVAACGGSPLAAKPDPYAVVHTYAAQGFSIAYGPQWQVSQQDATPQTAWQLDLRQPYNSSTATGAVLISIGVQPEHAYRDPAVYQAKYEQVLKAMGGSPQSITVSGVPAVYWKGISGDGVSLASGGRCYVLMGTISSDGDASRRPQVLAVLDSFKLLAASASGSEADASQATASPAAVSSSAASSPSPRTPVSSHGESQQYVDGLAPVVAAFGRQCDVVGKAQDSWNPQDQSTWPALRKAVEKAVVQFAADEAEVKRADPPSSFRESRAQLIRSIDQLRDGYAYLDARLKTGQDASTWASEVVAKFTAAQKTLVLFKSEFVAACSQTGVETGVDLP